jgi:hypothetical protein
LVERRCREFYKDGVKKRYWRWPMIERAGGLGIK